MASSLLALLDDIATILDDVATLAKVATKKTAGVLGDDLALNAQQVTGMAAERELPVVWGVAKGSLVNKAILVPAALLLSAFLPWAITPLMVVGGLFLCFEGAEKISHRFLHAPEERAAEKARLEEAILNPAVDLVALERDKIKGAIRTDFILSAEIIVITLGAVSHASLSTRIGVLVSIAILMTVGVYGLVAAIVKLDDAGLALDRSPRPAFRGLGQGILRLAPYLMKGLSIGGTAAMFLVGGGILAHALPALHHLAERAAATKGGVALLFDGMVGLLAGAAVVIVVTAAQRLRGNGRMHASG